MSVLDLLPYLAVLSGPLTLLGLAVSVFGAARSKLRRAGRGGRHASAERAPGGRLTWGWVAAAAVPALLVAAAWGSARDVFSSPAATARSVPSAAAGTAPKVLSSPAGAAGCERTVALTFDDGPDPAITPKVLEHLDRHGVRATFFVVGKHVAYYPGLVHEIHHRGHTIGNHTYDHPRLPQIPSDGAVRAQFTRTSAAIAGDNVPRPTIWRPPYKALDRRIRALAGDMKLALWGVDSEDYRANGSARDDVVRTVMARVFDGAIVLLHDDHSSLALRALPRLITALRERGYCFGTLRPSTHWNALGPGQGFVEIVGARAARVRR